VNDSGIHRVVIFGASGKTGQHAVEQALGQGHAVTAFVRDPARLPVKHERLAVIQGDVRDPASVEQAVAGHDGVIAVLGQTRPPAPDLLATGVQNILKGMEKHGVRRLIYLTGAGVPDPEDQPSVPRTIIRGLMKLISPHVLEDSERAYTAIRASDMDWTVVRVPILTDKPGAGGAKTTFTPPGPTQICRADVAKFILNQLHDESYVRRAPMLTYS
jgi:putative NADH-flavin reductase